MKKINLKKTKDDTFWLRVLSVFIAIILWFYVNSIINPIKKKELIVPIRYNISTLPKGLVMKEPDAREVRIVVSGTQDELSKIDEKNIQAVVDFSEVRQTGEIRLPININNPYHRINIESVYPKNVMVNIDNLVTIQKDVTVEIDGNPKKGYIINGYQEEPNVISIKGAESDIKEISKCVAQLNLSLNDRPFKTSVPVKILDSRGKDITSLFDLSQKSIDVYVDILKTKQVPLTVKFKGKLEPNKVLSKIVLKPSTVNVAGKEEDINSLNEIVVGAIDTKMLQNVSTFQFDFNIPKNIKALDNVKRVVITIYTDSIVQKSITVPVEVRGLSSQYLVNLNPDKVMLKVKYYQSNQNSIDFSSFKAYVDVSNLTQGDYNLPLVLEKPNNIEDVEVSSSYIKVTITEKSQTQ
ncbi:CdaR family protein [Caldicellulosiruptor naganoensis]|uniref:CdaR family protein n=1 Tax=Caldicellulosiruptor naganoensis TaxID=29324 RepID=A0ABY7BGT0_9FIRM|nr:CdaR family protein [Caldicellulosiruptor naganoensis]WAM32029.1 CdaR family protein [Caldicellulosiruptor naganoensis]